MLYLRHVRYQKASKHRHTCGVGLRAQIWRCKVSLTLLKTSADGLRLKTEAVAVPALTSQVRPALVLPELQARALLDDLPQDQKDVMMLRIFGDLTVDQIATTLGKTSGAVKALQRRGLHNLRRRVLSAATPTDDPPKCTDPADRPTAESSALTHRRELR